MKDGYLLYVEQELTHDLVLVGHLPRLSLEAHRDRLCLIRAWLLESPRIMSERDGPGTCVALEGEYFLR